MTRKAEPAWLVSFGRSKPPRRPHVLRVAGLIDVDEPGTDPPVALSHHLDQGA